MEHLIPHQAGAPRGCTYSVMGVKDKFYPTERGSKGILGLVLVLGEGQETKRFPENLNHALEPSEVGRPSQRGLKGNKTKHNPRVESFMQRNPGWVASWGGSQCSSSPEEAHCNEMPQFQRRENVRNYERES